MGKDVKMRVEQSIVDDKWAGVRRVTLTITDVAGGLPYELFVFNRYPVDGTIGEVVDAFQNVASPVDLVEYPADAPDPDSGFQFFRKSTVTMDFRSGLIADQAVREIRERLKLLCAGLDAAERLRVVSDAWVVGDGSADSNTES